MEIRTGVDIIEVNRIKESIEQIGQVFVDRIFTEKEQEYCEKSNKMKYQHYAARFAAKEAIFKAISKNINNTSNWLWKNREIYNDEKGRPIADISKLEIKNIISQDLSISHIENYAMASFTLILDN